MPSFASKQERTYEATSSNATKATSSTKVSRAHSFLQVQGTVGNRAVQRMMRSDGGRHKEGGINRNSPQSAQDLGRRSVREAAEQGMVGSGGAFPHLDRIQRAFGRHDIGHSRAHQDPRAAASASAIGARAYTVGNQVAFAGAPDLHTAAHEAAHVVQQRGGVQLSGNVGKTGDIYERNADAVADRVVRGQSSEELLDKFAPNSRYGIPGNQVQMKSLDTAYGKFEDVYYDKITNKKDEEIGCEMYLRFTPGDTVDATKIGLTQIVKSYKEGKSNTVNETKEKQSVTTGKGKDFHIDQYAASRNPLYVTSDAPAANADKMEAWDAGPKVTKMSKEDEKKNAEAGKKGVKYDGLGQHGYRKKSGKDWINQPAELDDWPLLPDTVGKKNSGQSFETTALAIEGTQKDAYYGSVQWGWERDDKAAFKLIDFKVVSKGAPSSVFMAAADKWNTSKTSGNTATIKLPTVEVYTTSKEMDVLAGTEKIKLPGNTRVQVISKGATAKDPWNVKIVDGPSTGKAVSVDGTTLTKE